MKKKLLFLEAFFFKVFEIYLQFEFFKQKNIFHFNQ